MRRRSFFLTLFAGNLLLLGVVLAVSYTISYRYLNERYRERQIQHQRRLTRAVAHDLERLWPGPTEDLSPEQRQAVHSHVRSLATGLEPARLTVIARNGEVLGDSEADPAQMLLHNTPDRPEVLAALDGREGLDIRTSATLDTNFRYFAVPLRCDGEARAAVRLAMPVTAIVEGRGFIWRALLWSALAALAADLVLGLLVSWIWSLPLRQVTRAAAKLASGNLAARASPRGSDEVHRLAVALNQMRRNLAGQIQTAEGQRQNLETIVSNLRSGVMALDAQRRIVLMNHTAVELLAPGEADLVGKHVQSVVRIADIIDLLDQADVAGSANRQIEFEREGRRHTYDAYAALLARTANRDAIRALVVIRDITDIARTAQMKAEFVANASHELRTPLATLRAAVDSLTSVEPDDADAVTKFAAILDRHVQRLESMTSDLLDLHRVEQSRTPLHLEDVALDDLAEWARGQYRPKAENKNVAFTVETGDGDFLLSTDRTLVQLILQNLLDNAIKFTPTGGRVTCRFALRESKVSLAITDTGCGIPQEIQERVFERFFQADPARSGDGRVRGTGLGLAIVKHACERLGATVRLDSTVGHGTTVEVVVPVRR